MTSWPKFQGELRLDEAAIAEAAEDFGHVERVVPRAVLVPAAVDDVVALIAHAREHRYPIAARGQGHAMGGQPLAAGGVVIDTRSLAALDPVRGETVRVGAGATWIEVVRHAVAAGMVPPALTDFLGLSVGGTLSVGGIGGQAFRYGAQVDNVVSLEVVTGAGEVATCSRTSSPDLFFAVLAGLGQSAIVTAVELRLVRAPVRVRTYEALFVEPKPFLDLQDQHLASGAFGYVAGMVVPAPTGWAYLLQSSKFLAEGEAFDDDEVRRSLVPAPVDFVVHDRAPIEFFDRSAAQMVALKEAGIWGVPHPWLTQFLPRREAQAFVERLVARVSLDDIGQGYIAVYPVRRSKLGAPMLRTPDDEEQFLVGLLPNALPATPERLASLLALGRELYVDGRSIGGRCYPIGLLPDPELWPAHFGGHWANVVAQKRRFDPDGILTPGFGLVWP